MCEVCEEIKKVIVQHHADAERRKKQIFQQTKNHYHARGARIRMSNVRMNEDIVVAVKKILHIDY